MVDVLLSVALLSLIITLLITALISVNEIVHYNNKYSQAVLYCNNILEEYCSQDFSKLPSFTSFAGKEPYNVEIKVKQLEQFYLLQVSVSWEQNGGIKEVVMKGFQHYEQ